MLILVKVELLPDKMVHIQLRVAVAANYLPVTAPAPMFPVLPVVIMAAVIMAVYPVTMMTRLVMMHFAVPAMSATAP